ncbi:MAG: flavin reductase family protein [Candidatus Lokiarchaeota archaeon]|jgi:flavin reductase (DIM6/NTAB) family NADH-FMN oxidoreductase RutF|nr:flavin reductase family protein [Candidatus Lokiarchaeota archaeon]
MKKKLKPYTAIIPCPVALVSVAGEEKPNMLTISWMANVCSKPPKLAIGVRPSRYSHQLIKDAGDFVVNIPPADLVEAAALAGSKSGKDIDKFEYLRLTAASSSDVTSPRIEECIINIECRTSQVIDIGSHDLFIAEVVAVHVDESILDSKDRLDPMKANAFVYLPLIQQYWTLGERLR